MPYCERCHNEGMYLEDEGSSLFLGIFCSCQIGQERKKNWEAYNEKMKAEAMRYRRKKRRIIKDYRAAAAGEDDNNVPF